MILSHTYDNPPLVIHSSGTIGRMERRIGTLYLIGLTDPQMDHQYPLVSTSGSALYIITSRENLKRFNHQSPQTT